jgi:predicted permease
MGGVLYQYRPSADIGPITLITITSLLLHPMLVLFFGSQLALDTQGIRSAVLTSAMAPGINAYIFSNMYGRGQRVAASTVLLTTIGSLFTIWAWLKILP